MDSNATQIQLLKECMQIPDIIQNLNYPYFLSLFARKKNSLMKKNKIFMFYFAALTLEILKINNFDIQRLNQISDSSQANMNDSLLNDSYFQFTEESSLQSLTYNSKQQNQKYYKNFQIKLQQTLDQNEIISPLLKSRQDSQKQSLNKLFQSNNFLFQSTDSIDKQENHQDQQQLLIKLDGISDEFQKINTTSSPQNSQDKEANNQTKKDSSLPKSNLNNTRSPSNQKYQIQSSASPQIKKSKVQQRFSKKLQLNTQFQDQQQNNINSSLHQNSQMKNESPFSPQKQMPDSQSNQTQIQNLANNNLSNDSEQSFDNEMDNGDTPKLNQTTLIILSILKNILKLFNSNNFQEEEQENQKVMTKQLISEMIFNLTANKLNSKVLFYFGLPKLIFEYLKCHIGLNDEKQKQIQLTFFNSFANLMELPAFFSKIQLSDIIGLLKNLMQNVSMTQITTFLPDLAKQIVVKCDQNILFQNLDDIIQLFLIDFYKQLKQINLQQQAKENLALKIIYFLLKLQKIDIIRVKMSKNKTLFKKIFKKIKKLIQNKMNLNKLQELLIIWTLISNFCIDFKKENDQDKKQVNLSCSNCLKTIIENDFFNIIRMLFQIISRGGFMDYQNIQEQTEQEAKQFYSKMQNKVNQKHGIKEQSLKFLQKSIQLRVFLVQKILHSLIFFLDHIKIDQKIVKDYDFEIQYSDNQEKLDFNQFQKKKVLILISFQKFSEMLILHLRSIPSYQNLIGSQKQHQSEIKLLKSVNETVIQMAQLINRSQIIPTDDKSKNAFSNTLTLLEIITVNFFKHKLDSSSQFLLTQFCDKLFKCLFLMLQDNKKMNEQIVSKIISFALNKIQFLKIPINNLSLIYLTEIVSKLNFKVAGWTIHSEINDIVELICLNMLKLTSKEDFLYLFYLLMQIHMQIVLKFDLVSQENFHLKLFKIIDQQNLFLKQLLYKFQMQFNLSELKQCQVIIKQQTSIENNESNCLNQIDQLHRGFYGSEIINNQGQKQVIILEVLEEENQFQITVFNKILDFILLVINFEFVQFELCISNILITLFEIYKLIQYWLELSKIQYVKNKKKQTEGQENSQKNYSKFKKLKQFSIIYDNKSDQLFNILDAKIWCKKICQIFNESAYYMVFPEQLDEQEFFSYLVDTLFYNQNNLQLLAYNILSMLIDQNGISYLNLIIQKMLDKTHLLNSLLIDSLYEQIYNFDIALNLLESIYYNKLPQINQFLINQSNQMNESLSPQVNQQRSETKEIQYYISVAIVNIIVEKPFMKLNKKLFDILISESHINICMEIRIFLILLKSIKENANLIIESKDNLFDMFQVSIKEKIEILQQQSQKYADTNLLNVSVIKSFVNNNIRNFPNITTLENIFFWEFSKENLNEVQLQSLCIIIQLLFIKLILDIIGQGYRQGILSHDLFNTIADILNVQNMSQQFNKLILQIEFEIMNIFNSTQTKKEHFINTKFYQCLSQQVKLQNNNDIEQLYSKCISQLKQKYKI